MADETNLPNKLLLKHQIDHHLWEKQTDYQNPHIPLQHPGSLSEKGPITVDRSCLWKGELRSWEREIGGKLFTATHIHHVYYGTMGMHFLFQIKEKQCGVFTLLKVVEGGSYRPKKRPHLMRDILWEEILTQPTPISQSPLCMPISKEADCDKA